MPTLVETTAPLGNYAASITATFASPAAAGETIVAYVLHQGQTTGISVTASDGRALTKGASTVDASGATAQRLNSIYILENAGGVTSVTLSIGSSNAVGIVAQRWSDAVFFAGQPAYGVAAPVSATVAGVQAGFAILSMASVYNYPPACSDSGYTAGTKNAVSTTWYGWAYDTAVPTSGDQGPSWGGGSQIGVSTIALAPATTSVTRSTSTSWSVAGQAQSTRSTTWRALASQTASRATTWKTSSALAATVSMTWRALSGVLAPRSGLWRTLAAAASSRAGSWAVLNETARSAGTLWQIRTAVARTADTSWVARSTLQAARSTMWAVAGATSPVSAARASAWLVASAAARASSTAWTSRALAGRTETTTWQALAHAAATRPTAWTCLAAAATSRSTSWVTDSTGTVATTRATGWTVRAAAGKARSTSWTAAAATAANQSILWQTCTLAGATASTAWAVASTASVATTRAASWATAAPVGTSSSAGWATLTPAGRQSPTTWATLARGTTSAATGWTVDAGVADSRTALWSTGSLTPNGVPVDDPVLVLDPTWTALAVDSVSSTLSLDPTAATLQLDAAAATVVLDPVPQRGLIVTDTIYTVGDTKPDLTFTCMDGATAANITGASIVPRIKFENGDILTKPSGDVTIVDGPTGRASFPWTADGSDFTNARAGVVWVDAVVTFAGGAGTQTFRAGQFDLEKGLA